MLVRPDKYYGNIIWNKRLNVLKRFTYVQGNKLFCIDVLFFCVIITVAHKSYFMIIIYYSN